MPALPTGQSKWKAFADICGFLHVQSVVWGTKLAHEVG